MTMTEIRNTDTNKIVNLELIDPRTGNDWSAEFISDDCEIHFNASTCEIEADTATIKHWQDLIARYTAMANRRHDFIQSLDGDKLDEFYTALGNRMDMCTDDYDSEIAGVNAIIDEWEIRARAAEIVERDGIEVDVKSLEISTAERCGDSLECDDYDWSSTGAHAEHGVDVIHTREVGWIIIHW
jgi:hypothetical protein